MCLTASLWLTRRNELAKGKKGFIELPKTPNWLVTVRTFRRDDDKRLLESKDN
jgi:hypothetical protein